MCKRFHVEPSSIDAQCALGSLAKRVAREEVEFIARCQHDHFSFGRRAIDLAVDRDRRTEEFSLFRKVSSSADEFELRFMESVEA